jgi:hypothetical protein
MTEHDWYVDNRVAFATRVLEANEEALFAAHLACCEQCRLAVAQLEGELAWLPMGVAPVVPRPGLTRDLAANVLHHRPRGHRRRWGAWLAAAGLLAIALRLWLHARVEIAALRQGLETREQRLAALQDTLSAILGAERVLQETIRGPGYEGGVLLFYDQDTERWNIVVHDLPPAPAGAAYQLWFLTSHGLRPGPVLQLTGARPTFVTLPAPGPVSEVRGAVLTLGPGGGAWGELRGTELARLSF